MRVLVISPERAVYDGVAEAVVVPCYDGEVGILPRHAPFMSLLGRGTLTVTSGSSSRQFRVQGGFLQVVSNTVRVVAEHVQGDENAA